MSPSVSIRLLLTQSDARLAEYARSGHERAFEALVRRYRRRLHAYCRRLLLSDERAEDALQQALLQAWMSLRDGIEVREVRPWLYRIVHNVAVNTLRSSGYDYCTLSESLSGADAPQADLDRRIAVREALAGLAALPAMQREALLRTAVEGRSHQQVAGDLGVSEPALRGLVYRARASLRAAAGAIVPPPLLEWALRAGASGAPTLEGLAGTAGAGSAGLAGLLVKGSAVAVTAGALAGGIIAHSHRRDADTAAARRPRDATSYRAASAGAQVAAGARAGADVASAVFERPQHRRRATELIGGPRYAATPPTKTAPSPTIAHRTPDLSARAPVAGERRVRGFQAPGGETPHRPAHERHQPGTLAEQANQRDQAPGAGVEANGGSTTEGGEESRHDGTTGGRSIGEISNQAGYGSKHSSDRGGGETTQPPSDSNGEAHESHPNDGRQSDRETESATSRDASPGGEGSSAGRH